MVGITCELSTPDAVVQSSTAPIAQVGTGTIGMDLPSLISPRRSVVPRSWKSSFSIPNEFRTAEPTPDKQRENRPVAPAAISLDPQPPSHELGSKNVRCSSLATSVRAQAGSRQTLGQMLLEQSVDLRRQGNGHEWSAWVHAIIFPILRPFLCGVNKFAGEISNVRESTFNFQTACQADMDVGLHDGKLWRGQTFLPLAFLKSLT